jgi:hypothetical protein
VEFMEFYRKLGKFPPGAGAPLYAEGAPHAPRTNTGVIVRIGARLGLKGAATT